MSDTPPDENVGVQSSVSFDPAPAMAWVDEAFTAIASMEGEALDSAVRATEVLSRRMSALRSAAIARSIESRRYAADGHRRAGGWVAAMTGASRQEAGVAARVAGALSSMPKLRDAFDSGAVSIEAVEIITRRFSDDRVAERLIAGDEVLTRFSIGRSSDEVRRLMSGWDRMADPAGDAEAAERASGRRQVKIVRKDGEVRIYARFGAAQGEEIAAVHERFATREFERDAAAAVDGELPRSADQRSADAFATAMETADTWFSRQDAPCPTCGTPVPTPSGSREPLTSLVFDEESLRRWFEGDVAADVTDLDLLRRFAAGTSDGAPVPADDIVRAMVLGQVRVILRRSDGVITSVGRRQRLFRGLIRDAVTLQHPTCIWPGCGVPASRCEADHLHPHGDGGHTASTNGGPLCGFHNRFKAAHGFRVERGDEGRWHVLRPDGTPITADPPPGRDRAGPGAA